MSLLACSNCGNDLTERALEMLGEILPRVVHLRGPSVVGMKVANLRVKITCKKCKEQKEYPISIEEYANLQLERKR